MPNLTIQPVAADDAARLLELSRRTFFDAFSHNNDAASLDAFAAKAFTLPTFEEQLSNSSSEFYYAFLDNELAGFLKLNYGNAQTEFQDPVALEVERIYVLKKFQGNKIGDSMLSFAIEKARSKHFAYVWLGVWEHNAGAIRFYERKGFKVCGSHTFLLGAEQQNDLLMKLELEQ